MASKASDWSNPNFEIAILTFKSPFQSSMHNPIWIEGFHLLAGGVRIAPSLRITIDSPFAKVDLLVR
jgi:hypothetical protein